jgi:Raf kinase inhibitor-like YbhB/YbcL family protein
MTLTVSSPAWEPGETIPKRYTGDGEELSPPLKFGGAPNGTRSLALTFTDIDAPFRPFVHWVLYDIPATTAVLPEGVPKEATSLPDGTRQGTGSWKSRGYVGPRPPRGRHRYVFRLYALGQDLGLPPGLNPKELEKAIQGRILEVAEFTGTYSRA